MDSSIAALLGALIGGGATVLANLALAKSQNRQRRLQAATDLAIKEHEFDLINHKSGKNLKFSMLAEYVAYHDAALNRIEKGLDNTPDALEELAKKFGVI